MHLFMDHDIVHVLCQIRARVQGWQTYGSKGPMICDIHRILAIMAYRMYFVRGNSYTTCYANQQYFLLVIGPSLRPGLAIFWRAKARHFKKGPGSIQARA